MAFARQQFCPECGGPVTWSANECRYCQSGITWFTRLHWAGKWGQLLILAAGLGLGAILGVIGFQIPKPDPATALAATVVVWYFHGRLPHGGSSAVTT